MTIFFKKQFKTTRYLLDRPMKMTKVSKTHHSMCGWPTIRRTRKLPILRSKCGHHCMEHTASNLCLHGSPPTSRALTLLHNSVISPVVRSKVHQETAQLGTWWYHQTHGQPEWTRLYRHITRANARFTDPKIPIPISECRNHSQWAVGCLTNRTFVWDVLFKHACFIQSSTSYHAILSKGYTNLM